MSANKNTNVKRDDSVNTQLDSQYVTQTSSIKKRSKIVKYVKEHKLDNKIGKLMQVLLKDRPDNAPARLIYFLYKDAPDEIKQVLKSLKLTNIQKEELERFRREGSNQDIIWITEQHSGETEQIDSPDLQHYLQQIKSSGMFENMINCVMEEQPINVYDYIFRHLIECFPKETETTLTYLLSLAEPKDQNNGMLQS